jgi:hypothetical protein
MRVLRAAIVAVLTVAAGLGALAPLRVAAAPATCDVAWSSGAAPSASASDTVCVTGDVTLGSSQSWGGLEVEAGAKLTVLSTADCMGAEPITLSTADAVDIATNGALDLETSCATGGDSTLQAGTGITVSGQLGISDCDSDLVNPHCGGDRHIVGSVTNDGTVTVDGTAADVSGAQWDNAGTLALNDRGSLTALAGSLAFTNEPTGLINGVDNVGGPRLSLESGDSFNQAGGSVKGMLVGLTDAGLAVTGAGAAAFEAFGDDDWTGGFQSSAQSIWLSCVGSTTVHVDGAAVNSGRIFLGGKIDSANPCTGSPTLALDGADPGLVSSGRIDVGGPASITGAAALSIPGLLDATGALTLDAPPADLTAGTLTTGEWDIGSGGSVSWPGGSSSEVTTLAGDVDFLGPGTLPNFDLSRVSATGSLGITGGELLTTAAGGFTNDGLVSVDEGRLTVPAGGSYVQAGGQTQIDANGTMLPGAELHVTGGVLGGMGTVDGDLVASGGVVDASFGRPFTVTGSYTQAKAAVLKVEETTTPPTFDDYSVLDAARAKLAGTVSAVLDYNPPVGTTDQVIDAPGGVTGTFGAVKCLGYDCAPSYSSTAASIVLGKQQTRTTLTLSRSQTTYGGEGDTRVTVTVRGVSFDRGGLSGRVRVVGGGRTLCSMKVSAGSGSCHLGADALSAGTHALHAVFAGATNDDGSSSGPVRLVVVPSRTRTSLHLSTRRIRASDESRLHFTVTVTPSAVGRVTGRVAVKVGTDTACTAKLTGAGGASTATCSLRRHFVTEGTFAAWAVYRRSVSFKHSSSGLHMFKVTG